MMTNMMTNTMNTVNTTSDAARAAAACCACTASHTALLFVMDAAVAASIIICAILGLIILTLPSHAPMAPTVAA